MVVLYEAPTLCSISTSSSSSECEKRTFPEKPKPGKVFIEKSGEDIYLVRYKKDKNTMDVFLDLVGQAFGETKKMRGHRRSKTVGGMQRSPSFTFYITGKEPPSNVTQAAPATTPIPPQVVPQSFAGYPPPQSSGLHHYHHHAVSPQVYPPQLYPPSQYPLQYYPSFAPHVPQSSAETISSTTTTPPPPPTPAPPVMPVAPAVTPTPASAAATSETPPAKPPTKKHYCSHCGKERSLKFHLSNPIKLGAEPLDDVCRTCRKNASDTSDEEAEDIKHNNKENARKEESVKSQKKEKVVLQADVIQEDENTFKFVLKSSANGSNSSSEPPEPLPSKKRSGKERKPKARQEDKRREPREEVDFGATEEGDSDLENNPDSRRRDQDRGRESRRYPPVSSSHKRNSSYYGGNSHRDSTSNYTAPRRARSAVPQRSQQRSPSVESRYNVPERETRSFDIRNEKRHRESKPPTSKEEDFAERYVRRGHASLSDESEVRPTEEHDRNQNDQHRRSDGRRSYAADREKEDGFLNPESYHVANGGRGNPRESRHEKKTSRSASIISSLLSFGSRWKREENIAAPTPHHVPEEPGFISRMTRSETFHSAPTPKSREEVRRSREYEDRRRPSSGSNDQNDHSVKQPGYENRQTYFRPQQQFRAPVHDKYLGRKYHNPKSSGTTDGYASSQHDDAARYYMQDWYGPQGMRSELPRRNVQKDEYARGKPKIPEERESEVGSGYFSNANGHQNMPSAPTPPPALFNKKPRSYEQYPTESEIGSRAASPPNSSRFRTSRQPSYFAHTSDDESSCAASDLFLPPEERAEKKRKKKAQFSSQSNQTASWGSGKGRFFSTGVNNNKERSMVAYDSANAIDEEDEDDDVASGLHRSLNGSVGEKYGRVPSPAYPHDAWGGVDLNSQPSFSSLYDESRHEGQGYFN